MDGKFTRGEKSDHKITASYTGSENIKYSDKKCPPETKTLNCTLTLTRKRVK